MLINTRFRDGEGKPGCLTDQKVRFPEVSRRDLNYKKFSRICSFFENDK